MHCRAFRKSHVAFVDRLMPERRVVAMYEHLDDCERCARFDAAVRRGLLVARNLPSIKPSPEFRCRLQQQLDAMASGDPFARSQADRGEATAHRASISA